MSKWCETCYRNEMTGEWKPCGNDCPVFGNYFEDIAKMAIKHNIEKSKSTSLDTALEILQNPIFDDYNAYMGAVLFVSEAFNMSIDSVLEHIKM